MKYLVILLFAFLIISCNQKETPAGKAKRTITIDISNKEHITEQIKSIKLIPLETRHDNLIASVKKINYQFNRFFIHDMQMHNLLVFNSEGRYIRHIGKRGKGPGEYSFLYDFSISNDSLIYLLTYKRIIIYNLNGEYINTIEIKNADKKNAKIYLNPPHFATTSGKEFYLWQGTFGYKLYDENMPYLMYKLSSNGELLNEKFFPVERINYGKVQFYPCFDGINIIPPFGSYKIYKISDNEVFENIQINFGNNTLNDNQLERGHSKIVAEQIYDLKMNSKFCVNIDYFLETKDYYYFTYTLKGTIYQVLYSKKTDYFSNNKLSPFTLMQCTFDECLISVLEPYFLENISGFISESLISNELYYKFQELNIEMNSNPILIKYEINRY